MQTNSKIVTSDLSACKKTAMIWKELSRTGSEYKEEAIIAVFSNNPWFNNDCPCCEFAGHDEQKNVNCHICPMKDFWQSNSNSYMCSYIYMSNELHAIYLLWAYEETIEKRKIYATTIYHMALEASEYWQGMKDMNTID